MIYSKGYLFYERGGHVFVRKYYDKHEFRITQKRTRTFSVAVHDDKHLVMTDEELLVCSGHICFIQRHDMDSPRLIQANENKAVAVNNSHLFRLSLNGDFVSYRQAYDIMDEPINDVVDLGQYRILIASEHRFSVIRIYDYNTVVEHLWKKAKADFIIPLNFHEFMVSSDESLLKFSTNTGKLVCEYHGSLPEKPYKRLNGYLVTPHYVVDVKGDEIASHAVREALTIEDVDGVTMAYDKEMRGHVI